MKVIEELQPIFRDIFDDETISVNEQTTAADIEDWDSLAQIRLIVAIEKHFRIKFATADIVDLENVGDMVKLIERNLNK